MVYKILIAYEIFKIISHIINACFYDIIGDCAVVAIIVKLINSLTSLLSLHYCPFFT